MKRFSFRPTFLFRFTLLTLVVSTLAAVVLAIAIEDRHRHSLEERAEASVLSRVDADLAGPLNRLGTRGVDTAKLRREFESASRDAARSEFAEAVRIYRPSGNAVYPSSAVAAPADVHAAMAANTILSVERGDTITAYQPMFTDDEHPYVIAVDFSAGLIDEQIAEDRRQIVIFVAAAVAIIFFSLVTLAAGASRELEKRRREARHTFVTTLEVMAETIDLRDPYTAGHSKRVATYSRTLAEAAGLPRSLVESIEGGALLHDIGKIAIPDRVLFKPAKLDPDERLIIETHPVVGAKLLANVPAMEEVTRCVLHHHERLDGCGYPDKLLGDAIPLGSRVIAIADTFDAMTTDRPYRRGLSVESAVAELKRVAGTQLDAALVGTFLALIARGEITVLAKPVDPEADMPAFGRKLEMPLTG